MLEPRRVPIMPPPISITAGLSPVRTSMTVWGPSGWASRRNSRHREGEPMAPERPLRRRDGMKRLPHRPSALGQGRAPGRLQSVVQGRGHRSGEPPPVGLTRPSSSRSRSLSRLVAIPGSPSEIGVPACARIIISRTTSMVHRSPTTSRALATAQYCRYELHSHASRRCLSFNSYSLDFLKSVEHIQHVRSKPWPWGPPSGLVCHQLGHDDRERGSAHVGARAPRHHDPASVGC